MAYEVYLGDCLLYGVSAIEESAGRNVTERDAIGTGIFTMPQSPGLKSFSIKLELTEQDDGQDGWRRASAVIHELHAIRKDKRARQLVVISERHKLSQRVLLRDIRTESSYQGVYSVSLSLLESVTPKIKSVGAATVARPGTVPVTPTTIRAISAYDDSRARANKSYTEVPDSSILYPVVYKDPDTGKTVNPAAEGDKPVVVTEGLGGGQGGSTATNSAITRAYEHNYGAE